MIGQAALDVPAAYLEAAETAGLVHRLGDLPVVAGLHVDALTGENQCLVEYADRALLTDIPGLLDQLFRRFPSCTSTVVRLPADIGPSPYLEPVISYLRFLPDRSRTAATPSGTALRIALDDGSFDEQVRAWLAQALIVAQSDRGNAADVDAVTSAVTGIMSAPARRTWTVHTAGRREPIGHATALIDAFDDVTGTAFVDLVDILIDDPAQVRAATAALVDACAAEAGRLGLPIIGNVCHPSTFEGRDPAAETITKLCRRGWRPVYRYCSAPRPAGARPASRD
ncbi:MAG: hypothetical protein JWN03_1003 [Nocardia sp.]|uniref:hypothetical protein n=1 Tax=Nocardia sp. TaxID=1821 RepID=UPI00260907D6|nr:hypothetical protein [Nocardia sp.]MCU1640728.1 hypothetical protein [Nocardia sp.]